MGIRISEMEEATTFGADDYVPIVTSGTNKKALGQKIKDFIAGFFVSKSGDTMSGDLTVEKSNGDFVSKNPNITINTSANNGVTSSQTEGFMIKDSANNNIARFISVQETTGDVLAQMAAFNKKTDGTATTNYINVTIKKDGTSSYTVSDPAAFRSAIGAASNDLTTIGNMAAVSVATSTPTLIYSQVFSKGIWLLHFIANWDKKSGGIRAAIISTNPNATINGARADENIVDAGNNAAFDWFHGHMKIIELTSDTTIYFKVYQNSGDALNIYPAFSFLKLK